MSAAGRAPDGARGRARGGAPDGAPDGARGGAPDGARGGAPDGARGGAAGGARGGAAGRAPDGAAGRAPDGAAGRAAGAREGAAPRGHAWLVGAGPGAPGLITLQGLEALRRAEVVLYDRLAPAELLDHCPPEAERIDVGKAAGAHAMTQEEIHAALIAHVAAGRRVVRLKGGDPFVFGRGGEEVTALREAGLGCTVVPGVTSAIGGLAAAGIPITDRRAASSFAVVTGHEDPAAPGEAARWERLACATDTLVVLMGVGRLPAIVSALLAGGRDPRTPAALVERAATAEQRVVTAPLDEIAAAAEAHAIVAPALFVVGDVVALRARVAPQGRGPLAGRRVLVTRTRRQASTLAGALAAEGALPLLLPAIAIERRADPARVAAALDRLRAGAYDWVVCTSENATAIFAELLAAAGLDARAFAGARIAAVGTGTARALAAVGLRPDLLPAEAVGEALADALVAAGVRGASVLWPRAEGARPVIAERLAAAGAMVDELPLYLAAPPAEVPAGVRAAVQRGEIDAVTFTSASTVRNLVQVLGDDLAALRGAVVACIGPVTAQAARAAGLRVDVVAEPHTVDGLVAALRDFLQSRSAVPGDR